MVDAMLANEFRLLEVGDTPAICVEFHVSHAGV